MASRQNAQQNGTVHALPHYTHYSWHSAAHIAALSPARRQCLWSPDIWLLLSPLLLVQLPILLHHLMSFTRGGSSAQRLTDTSSLTSPPALSRDLEWEGELNGKLSSPSSPPVLGVTHPGKSTFRFLHSILIFFIYAYINISFFYLKNKPYFVKYAP